MSTKQANTYYAYQKKKKKDKKTSKRLYYTPDPKEQNVKKLNEITERLQRFLSPRRIERDVYSDVAETMLEQISTDALMLGYRTGIPVYGTLTRDLLGSTESVPSIVSHGTPTTSVAVDESTIYGRDNERLEDSEESAILFGLRGVHTSQFFQTLQRVYENEFFQALQRVYENDKTWRIVGVVSSVPALSCLALSPSFNHLIRGWEVWKYFLYGVFSSVVLILLVKPLSFSARYVPYKIVGFVVLMFIAVYTFYYDKAVNENPEIRSLVSNVAFALMSLSMSKLMKFGHEMGIFSFFLTCFIVQLWTINRKLILVAIFFGAPLFVMHFSSDPKYSSSDSRQDQRLDDMERGAMQPQKTH